MKSAKIKKSLLSPLLLLLIISLCASLAGCGKVSFLPSDEEPPPASDPNPSDIPSSTPDVEEPPKILFYQRYTGLVCDESLLSCRPISVCIGNFDNTVQKGLSKADLIFEAPIDGDKTRLWATFVNPSAMPEIGAVSSIRDYMMPIASAFGSITAYAGTTDTVGTPVTSFKENTLDYYYNNLTSTFVKNEQGTLNTSGEALLRAASDLKYSLTDTGATLPYRFAEVGTTFVPVGNQVNTVYYRYSLANTVLFSYDKVTGSYLRSQSSAPHTDSATGEQLAFQNVILLFHNVNYYHTATGTSFTLDTATGGDGYCYTGGGVLPICWHYAADGSLILEDESGAPLTVNRGKTYIGMLRVTDSASLIAK